MIIKAIAGILLVVIGGLIVYIIDSADRKEVKRLNGALDSFKKDREFERARYETDLKRAYEDIDKLCAINSHTPSDCKTGEWCRACAFVKEYKFVPRYGSVVIKYYCGKAESCNNFVENKEI